MLMDILMEALMSMDDESLDYVLESCDAEELEIIDSAMEMKIADRSNPAVQRYAEFCRNTGKAATYNEAKFKRPGNIYSKDAVYYNNSGTGAIVDENGRYHNANLKEIKSHLKAITRDDARRHNIENSKNNINKIKSTFINAGKDAVNGVKTAVKNDVDKTLQDVKTVKGKITKATTNVYDSVGSKAARGLQHITDKITK